MNTRLSLSSLLFLASVAIAGAEEPIEHRLYVAAPGIREYLEYGGHGVLVFDIDHGHRFVKRIATRGLDPKGKPLNVKGICASAATKRLYVSTTRQLMCLDLLTEKLLWEKSYPEGCDRMSMTSDGKRIFVPSLEGDLWNVVRGSDGAVESQIIPKSGAHNTIVDLDGQRAYLAGLKSPDLTIVDAVDLKPVIKVGPFSNVIRPFTINRAKTLCYVNLNGLLGFEIGDMVSGKKLARVEVEGFSTGPTKRHGCPSHGIALSPDEKEIWLTDAHNSRLHLFDATQSPPVYRASVTLKDQPGWVTFSLDGRYVYPSTGDVIDARTHEIVASLKDEHGQDVQSEKMMEIDFAAGVPVQVGDQFGLGRARP